VDGSVGPGDASARAALASTITGLRTDGYLVRLGTSFTDETGGRYDGAEEASMLADPMWRSHVTDALGPFVAMSDGVELDLQQLPTTARPSLSALASAVATSLHSKGSTVGVLVPPSTMDPSDLPGGDAFDVTTLATMVDRIRVMTLDYSDQTPGPTIDPGWAVSAAKLAIGKAGTTHVDVAYPLYGVDFSSSGRRLVTFLEAEGIAATEKVAIGRGPTYAPRFSYDDPNGVAHQVWFDDSASTLVALRAWDPQALPANVGVVFYGLGAEDPSLWQSISEAMP
jgi:spore germination protein